ncbi:MAG: aminopeptidase N, partial [Chlamydiia bacterium]|nr:aminopeptidase N [Chlamydiia bacterium]
MKDQAVAQRAPETKRLEDYRPPEYDIETVELTLKLDQKETHVHAKLEVVRRTGTPGTAPLVLVGRKQTFVGVRVDGRALQSGEFTHTPERLEIFSLPERACVEITNTISPENNLALEGLYVSEGMLCTQNEPEGFRSITYFLDRPDVMARYTTHLIADKKRYPILLSNGNCIETGELENGRHFAVWADPFPKPCYLYAIVAGDLGRIEDHYVTASGKRVLLEIYCDHGNESRCTFAMEALKKSMQWDEEAFGLEYDLDRFMIVAVAAFNAGAMENKGLNIFNASCVLADPETTTDEEFLRIETIIAHEYFHNWTGNRVTCRDWFQLTLKEGLTVYRDQKFSETVHSCASSRISEVNTLRNFQFLEDSGPMAHPIQPKSYISINNFYTTTVYNKGSEVIRMIERMVGKEGFRKGIDLYFDRHDGSAVTTEEFVKAMEDANQRDFSQFRRWYDQAGTPHVTAKWEHDSQAAKWTLDLKQRIPTDPAAQPLQIPLSVSVYNEQGEQQALTGKESVLIEMTQACQSFVFDGVSEPVLPSINRFFTAPIQLEASYSDHELGVLARCDDDLFNRWNAQQELAKRELLAAVANGRENAPLSREYEQLFKALLVDQGIDPTVWAMLLQLPSESELGQFQNVFSIDKTHQAREGALLQLAQRYRDQLFALYRANCASGEAAMDISSMGQRKLKNTALALLMQNAAHDAEAVEVCMKQLNEARCMSDGLSALHCLVNTQLPEAEEALAIFERRWADEQLVMHKWLAVQSGAKMGFGGETVAQRVQALKAHPAF